MSPESTSAFPTVPTVAEKEHGLKSAGQRRINVMWEATQALVALAVTGDTLYVTARLALMGNGETTAFLLLSNAFFMVIGFYFGRTNHTKTGGIGGRYDDTR